MSDRQWILRRPCRYVEFERTALMATARERRPPDDDQAAMGLLQLSAVISSAPPEAGNLEILLPAAKRLQWALVRRHVSSTWHPRQFR